MTGSRAEKNFSNPPLWVLHKPGTKKRSKNAFSNPPLCELKREVDLSTLSGFYTNVVKKRSQNAFSNPPLCKLKLEEFSKSPRLMHRKKSNPVYDVIAIVGYGEPVIQDQQ
jgi:hypothetical protein